MRILQQSKEEPPQPLPVRAARTRVSSVRAGFPKAPLRVGLGPSLSLASESQERGASMVLCFAAMRPWQRTT